MSGQPTTELATLERILLEIWAEVFARKQIGIEDNFFDLGGDSLRGARIVARARARGIQISAQQIFDRETIAALLEVIDPPAADAAPSMPAIGPRADRSVAPTSFAQAAIAHRYTTHPSVFSHIASAFALRGITDRPALRRALQDVAARHDALRSGFHRVDGRWRYVVAADPSLTLVEEELTGVPLGEVTARSREAALRISAPPYDLAQGPLVRPYLAWLDGGDVLLILLTHHAVFDESSRDPFLADLMACYRHHAEGADAPAPLRLQPADFAAWQRALVRSQVGERQAAFWRERLAGLPRLRWPGVTERAPQADEATGLLAWTSPPDVLARLRAVCTAQATTTIAGLLAALGITLAEICGVGDLGILTSFGNRHHAETAPLIGSLFNALVVRCRLDAGMAARDVLARVRQEVLDAYAHPDVPLFLSPEVDADLPPGFPLVDPDAARVNLNYLREGTRGPLLSELGPVRAPGTPSPHDLLLFCREDAQELRFHLRYRLGVLDAERAAVLRTTFDRALRAVAAG